MTLLEILVRDLPKRGGWPEGVCHLKQYGSGLVFSSTAPYISKNQFERSVSWPTEMVTREQYEAALAAVEPEWNGDGLPPVGCECEIKRIADWMPVTIKFISAYHTVFTTFGGTEDCYQTCSLQFRPIRPEVDRKRDELAKALHIAAGAASVEHCGIGPLYLELADKIIAGEVPHLKIV